MANNEVVISLEAIEKSFKDVAVLKGVNLSVTKGSIFALLGSNGAGKTTVIKILSTLINPDGGKATICNYDVVHQAAKVREQISLTGQYAAVDEVLTGRENLCMIGALRHLPDVNSRADTLLKRFNLEAAANRRVSTYSGGMRRKLDIAMSIVGNPSVIFLDEPTTGLDPQSRSALWNIVKSLADSGATIFLTTQYLDEAEQLADMIAILNDGVIVAKGTPNDLKKNLPQGIIEFSFQNDKDLYNAQMLLNDFSTKCNNEMLSLSVVADGSIEQLTEIFNRINKDGINISCFTQKLPTLEDVFFGLIDEKQEVLK
jgi:ABC-2 type transport system ATP-binding protein